VTAAKPPVPRRPAGGRPAPGRTAAPGTTSRRSSAPRSAATGRFVATAIAEPTPAPSLGLELYLLRHADAGDPATWAGDDADRPLSKRGRKQARRLGELLKDLGWKPDAIVTSPKLRAAETAKAVGRKVRATPGVDERLGSGLDAGALGELVTDLGADVSSVVLVGHDPDFSSLASWLVGAPLSLRKGALARIDLPDRAVGAGRGSLRWLLPPDAVAG
jgi:phosphohistidine phosphatase